MIPQSSLVLATGLEPQLTLTPSVGGVVHLIMRRKYEGAQKILYFDCKVTLLHSICTRLISTGRLHDSQIAAGSLLEEQVGLI